MWPTDKHGIIHRSALLDIGVTDAEVKRALRSGEIVALDRGFYLPVARLPTYDVDDAVYRYKVMAAASHQSMALTHESAAAIHALATLKPDRSVVHFGTDRSSGGRRMPSRHIHTGVPHDALVVVGGIAVTSIARTAVDIAACTDLARALAVMDSALRLGVTLEELRAEASRHRIRGAAVVDAALRHADGRSANPGESWGRAQMIEAGLPVPDLQSEFELGDGSSAFTDYDWARRLIAEFDGLRKYGRDLRPGESIEDAVVREKVREDRLRDLGCDVVRFVWADLENRRMVPRVTQKLRRHGLL
ncbi:hypothetical protein JVX90_06060 [Gordonia sp. PDNC005]|uniref:type IV toxin-antitoxin system AbiEi family antitoxin domain-containing protein n=1 Tax=unclassified Gordonia (in: high G+C Gram-positive bacteria) TaxID=2657482 RepID=UPI00196652D6|nr:hypothetical protein [Gordonia sp. PDNC005]QRY63768.1 hypothetical protein JVX90_06060 [Gordonia sp. PDNC005]